MALKMAKNNNNLDEKVQAIKQLLDLFKFERMVYLGITILSLIVLIGCAIFLLIQQKGSQIPAVIGLFTSSGGVAYTCGRLLKMWGDAMHLLGSIKNEE